MKTGALILAAGASLRMGEPKQALVYKGSTLMRNAVESAFEAGCGPVLVVLGANRETVAKCLAGLPVRSVENPEWQTGMGSSIQRGVAAAMEDSSLDALLLMLSDQPQVSSIALSRLIETAESNAQFQIVASEYANSLGVPALFRRSVFPGMLRLNRREGAKSMMKDPRFTIIGVPMPEAEVDIDTPEDYRKALLNTAKSVELMTEAEDQQPGVSRRDFVGTVVAVGLAANLELEAQQPTATMLPVACKLNINGQGHEITIDPRVTLLDLCREHLQLTGTKKGCDHGQCGACTVLVNGRRVNSCLTLAVTVDGDTITTVEGLAKGTELHPVQAAFLEHDGYQCGYCTPGQICSAVALLDEARQGHASYVTANVREMKPVELSDDEIRERMSGNLCRCAAYPNIVTAVRVASQGRTA